MGQTGLNASFTGDVSRVDTEQKYPLGTLRLEDGKWYKYVKLLNDTAGVAGVAGDPVAFDAETGHETHTVVLDLDDADTAPLGAGVLAGTVAGVVDTAYYLWIQLTGPVVTTQAVPGSDGGLLKMSTTDKTFAAVAGHADGHCAYAGDASAKKIICAFPF